MSSTAIVPTAGTLSGQPIRAALVGAGYVSAYHLRALKSLTNVTVVGIADSDRTRAEKTAAAFGIPAVCGSLEEMITAKPDVVHILTPPGSHRDLSIRAMNMGCHVLVEKPMAETVEDCDLMMAAARATGRVLSVNHSARMDPLVSRAQDLVRSGAVGDVLAVHFYRNSDYPPYAGGPLPPPYRRGGYPFEDLGVHGLCLMESFIGDIKDVDVRYRATGRDPHLFFDEWHALVEGRQGMGQLYISWNSRPMQNELVVHGTRGMIVVDAYLQTLSVHRTMLAPKPLQRMIGTALVSAATLYRVPVNALKFLGGRLKPNAGIHVSVRRFYEALAAGEAPPVSAEEGRRIVFWIQQGTRKADEAKACAIAPSPAATPPRVLVTGSSGLLGSALLRRLRARGDTVRVLRRRPSPELADDPHVDVIYGDLGDPEVVDTAIRGIDVIYHVGAAMSGGKAAFDAGTIWGTTNIVAGSVRHNVKRLVYVSSVVLLDHAGHRPGTPVDETYALEPKAESRGFYTQAKLAAEQIVKEAIRTKGLPAVIVRPGQIFGRGAEKFPPAGTIAFAGRWIVVGNGELPLSMVNVEDVVDALLLAAERDNVVGSIFHVVDTIDDVTQNDYIEACRRIVGPTLRVWHVPRPVLMAAAFAAEMASRVTGRSLPLSPYRLRSSHPLGPFDCRAARDRLGWTPRLGSRQSLAQTGAEQPRPINSGQPTSALARAKDS